MNNDIPDAIAVYHLDSYLEENEILPSYVLFVNVEFKNVEASNQGIFMQQLGSYVGNSHADIVWRSPHEADGAWYYTMTNAAKDAVTDSVTHLFQGGRSLSNGIAEIDDENTRIILTLETRPDKERKTIQI